MIVAYFTGADPKVIISRSGIIKLIELLFLTIAMITFFSGEVKLKTLNISSLYFVSSMMVSAFLHTIFILLVFVLGGLAIQRTLLDLMVSSFYVVMLLIASIVTFVIAHDGTAVAGGVFLLFSAFIFAADCYVAFCNLNSQVTVGVVATPGILAGVQPHLQQQPTQPIRSQPYTSAPAYNTPPGLVGGGLYTIPMSGQGKGLGGGVGGQGDGTYNAYDNNDNIYSELGEGPATVHYREGGPENII